MDHSHWVY